jgi:hypothetical protein
MVLALVFERLKNFLSYQKRLRGHKPKLVNALRSHCSVTREIFCRSKTGASTILFNSILSKADTPHKHLKHKNIIP